ncbi:MAG TPA: hypothetical protein DCS44_07000 [Cyanobacteria bacterium UBA10660]|nr:hypothetical protein [Cyanobacteria bacterium UBA10660]
MVKSFVICFYQSFITFNSFFLYFSFNSVLIWKECTRTF